MVMRASPKSCACGGLPTPSSAGQPLSRSPTISRPRSAHRLTLDRAKFGNQIDCVVVVVVVVVVVIAVPVVVVVMNVGVFLICCFCYSCPYRVAGVSQKAVIPHWRLS